MKTLTFSPIPRNKLVSSQTLVHSAYVPVNQPYMPMHRSVHFSPAASHKGIYSNQVIADNELIQNRRRSNSQSNLEISGLSGNPPYLKSLENKIKLVIEENDKLNKALEEKRVELEGFKDLEPKVRVLLEENSHLRQLLKEEGKDRDDSQIPSLNHGEGVNEDLMNKLTFMVQENEKLESLIDSLQENFKREMESYQQETENKLLLLVQENERLNELTVKSSELSEKLMVLLQENEKMQRVVEDKNRTLAEIFDAKGRVEELLLESEARMRILIDENEKLNDVIEHRFEEEKTLEPRVHSILGKNSELLQIINQKNAKLNEIQQENLQLKKVQSYDQSNINEYELQMYPIRAEYEQLKLKFSDLSEENTKLLYEIHELKLIQEKCNPEDFNRLQEELKNIQEKLLLTNKEFIEQIKHSENEKSEISMSLREKCNLILAENEKLVGLVNSRNEENNELKKRLESLTEQFQDSTQENDDLKQKILKFKSEFEEFKVFVSLDAKRSEFLNSFDFKNLEVELKVNSEKCGGLENEKDMAWNEVAKLKEQLANAHRTMSKDKIDIENVYNQLNQLAIEKDFLSHKVIDLDETQTKYENELNILNTQLTQWKNMNEHNKNEINKLYNILKSRKNENQALIQRNEEMQKEINRLTKNSTELISENFMFKEKVSMLEAEFEKTSVESKKWQETAEGMQEHVDRFRKEVEEKVLDLEKLRQDYQEFVNHSIGSN